MQSFRHHFLGKIEPLLHASPKLMAASTKGFFPLRRKPCFLTFGLVDFSISSSSISERGLKGELCRLESEASPCVSDFLWYHELWLNMGIKATSLRAQTGTLKHCFEEKSTIKNFVSSKELYLI